MHRELIGIPEAHELVHTSHRHEVRGGEDTNIYEYEEYDSNGELVTRFTVRDSTDIHPPHKRTVIYDSFSPSGIKTGSGKLE
jgi:hypothetical protein